MRRNNYVLYVLGAKEGSSAEAAQIEAPSQSRITRCGMRLHTTRPEAGPPPRRTSQPGGPGRRRNGYAEEASMIGHAPAGGAPSRCYSRAAQTTMKSKESTRDCRGDSLQAAGGEWWPVSGCCRENQGRRRTAFGFSRLASPPSAALHAQDLEPTRSSHDVVDSSSPASCHHPTALRWRNCTTAATAFLFWCFHFYPADLCPRHMRSLIDSAT